MTIANIRYKRLIREIPLHKTAKDAIIASGFSENTANKQAKRVLNSAIKYQARDILDRNIDNVKTKELLSDIVGLSSEEVFSIIRKIATQDKDYSSALKAIAPVSKSLGYALQDTEDKTTIAPTLHLSFGSNSVDTSPIIELPIEEGGIQTLKPSD